MSAPADTPSAGNSDAPESITPTGSGTPLTEADYHRHPALSQSGARLLLPPNCPALYRYRMDNPQPHKAVFDFGKAAHREVLGQGEPIQYVAADNWMTKAAKEQKAEAYAAGEIPLLESQRGVIEGMAAKLREHPLAARLLDPASGKAEQSLFWTDPDSGVNLRGRLDFLPHAVNGCITIPDYKTAAKADNESFAKSAASYGYVMQDPWYRDLVAGLELAEEVSFVFIVQEKEAPYLVNVIELDGDALRIGRGLNRRAIQVFKECTANNYWPGYSDAIELVSLPVWFTRLNEEFVEMDLESWT